MRGWQANKKRPAILGLCPKLKYPPFYGGIIICSDEKKHYVILSGAIAPPTCHSERSDSGVEESLLLSFWNK